MKFLISQLAYFTTEREARANLRALFGYIGFLAAMVTVYATVFHVIKLWVEGESHSWITGFYWTLVVMSTLGFGDVTFSSDVGRFFSIVVLLSGVVFLLVVLPFLFIRLFYGPWLEARVRLRVPRAVPDDLRGHVVIAEHDAIAVGLVSRLREEGVPYVIVEPDPDKAARAFDEQLSVLLGEIDNSATYARAGAARARLVLANAEDTVNTNITLTVREVTATVPVVAIAEEEDAIDILRVSGANTVLPLKLKLGEYLASRVHAGRVEAHVVGRFRDLEIAEVPARDTPLVGLRVADTQLRRETGLSLLGLWTRGRLAPAVPATQITRDQVLVVAGRTDQVARLNALLHQEPPAEGPVIVIGAGKVGHAAARTLHRKSLEVHAIDRSAVALAGLADVTTDRITGEAADRETLERAGIARSPSLLLTTNDDAMNIYLAVYCRRLNPALRIISRVTHERNVEAIHRAGADFALSYTTIGVEAVTSLVRGHEPVLLGEGVELFSIPMPPSLANRTLRESGIGSRTGMIVVGIESRDGLVTRLESETVLAEASEIVLLGSREQRQAFADAYEDGRRS